MDSAIRPLRGPGLSNWDLSVFKKFSVGGDGERFLQLRLEMFNAFNHTQWNQINSAAQFDANGKLINLPSALGGVAGDSGSEPWAGLRAVVYALHALSRSRLSLTSNIERPCRLSEGRQVSHCASIYDP